MAGGITNDDPGMKRDMQATALCRAGQAAGVAITAKVFFGTGGKGVYAELRGRRVFTQGMAQGAQQHDGIGHGIPLARQAVMMGAAGGNGLAGRAGKADLQRCGFHGFTDQVDAIRLSDEPAQTRAGDG